MNITDVLMLNNTENIQGQGAQGTGKEGATFPADSLLFSLLLNGFKEISVPGQKSEENTDDLLQQESLIDPGILGQYSYLQILQNVFPAGKEANSGIKNEQSVSAVSLTNDVPGGYLLENVLQEVFQGNEENIKTGENTKTPVNIGNTSQGLVVNTEQFANDPNVPDKAVSQVSSNLMQEKPITMGPVLDQGNVTEDFGSFSNDIGAEGIKNPISRESHSLNSRDLDQYRKTLDQLEALAGKIELKTSQKVDYQVTDDVRNLSFSNNQPAGESSDETESTEISKSADNTTPLAAVTQGKGQTNSSARDNSSGKFPEKANDLQPLQFSTGKTDLLNPEKNPESGIKMPGEPGRAWEQVLDILKKQEFKNQEVKELSIQLQPAELGKVNVSLRMENGQVHLVMNASEQATGVILQSHMQELRNGLTQMGVACGNFEMNYRQSGEGGSGQESSRRGGYHYQNDEEVSALTGNNSYFSLSGSGSRINVSA